jgi:hypothetical protein
MDQQRQAAVESRDESDRADDIAYRRGMGHAPPRAHTGQAVTHGVVHLAQAPDIPQRSLRRMAAMRAAAAEAMERYNWNCAMLRETFLDSGDDCDVEGAGVKRHAAAELGPASLPAMRAREQALLEEITAMERSIEGERRASNARVEAFVATCERLRACRDDDEVDAAVEDMVRPHFAQCAMNAQEAACAPLPDGMPVSQI